MPTAEEIQAETLRRLEKYEGRNMLEQYALYMGLSQLLELGLKQLAQRLYGDNVERLERHTLGQMAGHLRQRGLRKDFLALLDRVVEHRNHIAHELLVGQAMLSTLGAGEARFEVRILQRGLYELEQLWFLYECTDQNDEWGVDAA